MKPAIRSLALTLLLIILQTTLVQYLSLEGVTPDLLVILVVYIALQEGQLRGTLWGFGIGLLLDILSVNFLGLSALSKTICGFLGGYFHNENKTQIILGSYRFLVIILASAFVHNIVYYMIFTRGTDIGLLRAVLQFGITSTLYTATVTLLPLFVFWRRHPLAQ